MRKLIFIITLFAIPFLSISQNEMDDIFNDGGLSESKNLAKFDIGSALLGDASLFYERTLTETITIEVGAGIAIPSFLPNIAIIQGEDFDKYPITSGYNFMIMPRFYMSLNAPESYYYGLQYRYKHYTLTGGDLSYNDLMFVFGTQFGLYKALYLDYNLAAGYRSKNGPSIPSSSGFDIPFVMAVSVKLCYVF